MSTLVRGVGPDFLDAVRTRLGAHGASDSSLGVAVEGAARDAGAVLGSSALRSVTRTVRDELFGAGRLQVLLDDPAVTDVLVNGPRDVWVERAGRLSRVDVDLGGADDVRALAVRLAAAGGQRLDDASPAVDARLPDGTRLHAVLPPVAGTCALISLRVVRSRAFTVEQLVASGTLAPAVVPVVRALVATRANLLISGATGSGKTTLLAALLSLVPHDERLVIVEEAGELAPAHPHVVRLLARHANVDGAGRVDLTDLVRHALRMRPDRIVLGECRGAEVREVLAALNTGHDGGCATVHANAAADVPARLEALAALAGLSREAVAAQAASAFDAVLHLRRADHRYVAEVGVVRRGHAGDLEVACAIRVDPSGATVPGPAWSALADRLGLPGARAELGPSR
ncbi:TadA family conjugal transfer-associated ATPase [Cellulomonas humilata]|uniref:Pilus assembly protein CpaF n=1 Tax=Cellulomonas humilata TaxID=144055 RepID=A0ABU0EIY7_9CELL|nr:TadA family conjugal transfer-associated ATPase [Cellulomonas humilata]MDQ0375167.1 pilus assembly protein CpaF [Cellulomonas humilata]